MSDNTQGFYDSFARIVNSDRLAVRADINVTAEQAADAARQMRLEFQDGKISASDVYRFCSRMAFDLDSHGGTCRGFIICTVLNAIVDRYREILVHE